MEGLKNGRVEAATSDRYGSESATHIVDGEDKVTMAAMDETEAPSKVEVKEDEEDGGKEDDS